MIIHLRPFENLDPDNSKLGTRLTRSRKSGYFQVKKDLISKYLYEYLK